MKTREEKPVRFIQLEPTSHCNYSCKTCIKGNFPDSWLSRELPLHLFKKLLPQLKNVKSIHLQGWGEPLLHPKLFTFIKDLTECGITTSFTTNGSIMSEEIAEKVLSSGLSGVTFSMAGNSARVQDPLRDTGSLAKVKQSMRTLSEKRKEHQNHPLKIGISYLLTPETIIELPDILSWCAKNRIDKLATVQLTQATCKTQEHLQLLLPTISFKQKWQNRWLNLQALYRGLNLQLCRLTPSNLPICDKNPLESIFIAADGTVSPCVFQTPPIKGNLHWRKDGKAHLRQSTSFGNINGQDLDDILQSEACRSFRSTFNKRIQLYDKALSKVSFGMDGTTQLELANIQIKTIFKKFPPPESCRFCHKINGY